MKYEVYTDLIFANDFHTFQFQSVGKSGTIHKGGSFIVTQLPHVFNLAFGDIKEDNEIDDHAISNNGDRNKILATLAKVIELLPTDILKNGSIFGEVQKKEQGFTG